MSDYILLTDGSVHAQTKAGTGASLLIRTAEQTLSMETLGTRIKVQQFVQFAYRPQKSLLPYIQQ